MMVRIPVDLEMVAVRVNHEPTSLLGLTKSELGTLMLLSAVVGIVVVAGGWLFFSVGALPMGFIAAALFVAVSARILRNVKRNRPDRYYIHKTWHSIASLFPPLAGNIVLRSGWWDVGRRDSRNKTKI